MLVIVNPNASTVSDRLRTLVVHALESRYEVTAIDTQRQGHAIELTREARDEGYDVVVAFGGDGTVNEVANALAGGPTPMTCLPGGATNVFCRVLGIPNEIVDATEHLLRVADAWHPRHVDLAHVNGRHFTFAAGYGLDASIVREVDQHPYRKRKFGEWYFTWSALRTFAREYLVRPPRLEMEAGGRRVRGVTAIVQNADPLSFFGSVPLRVAEGATLTNGTLAAVVLHRATPLEVPTVALRLFSRRLRIVDHRQITGFSGVTELRARAVDGRPIPLEMDGDWVGDVSEAVFGVTPRALRVVA
jgi:diacylglycerol kinase family enzyme